MSSQTAIAKLHAPLGKFVTSAAEHGSPDYGKSEKEQAEVAEWLEKVAQGDVAKPENLQHLDAKLTSRTYLVSNYFTAADAALCGALHPIFSQLQPAQYYTTPSLTRYFDHIQSLPNVRKAAEALAPAFSVVTFDIANAPKPERKPDAPKEKKKAQPAVPADAKAIKAEKAKGAPVIAQAKTTEPTANETFAKPKKEKKEKKVPEAADGGKNKGTGGGGKGAVAEEGTGEPVPSMIDLRVGRIIHVEKHPDADGLYVEQIDFGEETGPRTVVSGLVKYIPIDQMQDKYLVGVCNLKPASMRGIKSFAMVLAATSKDGKDGGVELIEPPPNSKPGERVYFEGPGFEKATPLSQLNPKKKIFETIQPGFVTLETREAAWVNPVTKSVHKIRTKDGVCLAPTFVGASLS